MPKLRRVDCAQPGIRRVRRGRGFSYVDLDGSRLTDPVVLQRISDLAIPPAWQDVWICPVPNGHIQATGTDAAGRRQYRYHDEWRAARDREKHERMLEFAAALPRARERMLADLDGEHPTKTSVLAAAARLLDLGFFRIGGEEYAEKNESYGLATLRRDHVTCTDGVLTFDYVAKSGKRRVQSVADDELCTLVRRLKRRRGGDDELLAYRTSHGWVDVRSQDINGYLREITGGDFTAKDFRTWHATVLCAVALAVSADAPTSETARRRAVARAVQEVAHYLGNTPAVCRASYIDPRVIDRYNDGITIRQDLHRLGADATFGELATQGPIEGSVLTLLTEPRRLRDGGSATAHAA
ncbi:MAG TPA: DNA topoisomerase IB [Mycobacteriales bacterium]|nr:DNA topoisomerase IB [Mycobacteriales bacterium]